MNDRSKMILRVLFGVVMLFVGATIALLVNNVSNPIGVLSRNLGLALIVTGTVTIFQEAILSPLRTDEIKDGFDRVFEILAKPGIRVIAPQRQGYSGYHKWLLDKSHQDLFFAGHSVLHRVDADFSSLGLLSVEKAMKQKVAESSSIRILFLDPTWDSLSLVANAEKQDTNDLRAALATTLGICKKLWTAIENERLPGQIEIHTCREFTHYAFHNVVNKENNEAEMLLGFYFASIIGTRSPLFLVENEQIKEYFEAHFNTVFLRGQKLLLYSRDGVKEFNHRYYNECRNVLSEHLGDKTVADKMP